jgi:hypothetical protein
MPEFHIHVDASWLDDSFARYLVETLSFTRQDFLPTTGVSFAPEYHLTKKMNSGHLFQEVFDDVVTRAKATHGMTGYLEGEYVAVDKTIATQVLENTVEATPFRLDLRPLERGTFRESEVHVTLDMQSSDPTVLHALTNAGMFSAYSRKPYGVAQTLTAQGTRKQVSTLLPVVLNFLEKNRVSRCSVKEERILDWWISGEDVVLPPVIDQIVWAPPVGLSPAKEDDCGVLENSSGRS